VAGPSFFFCLCSMVASTRWQRAPLLPPCACLRHTREKSAFCTAMQVVAFGASQRARCALRHARKS